LRALTDIRILRRSIAKLGTGTLAGLVGGLGATLSPAIGATGFSAATVGAGMVVGARIGVPAVVVGAFGLYITPWLRANGWLDAHAPFRKIGCIVALGMILGAAIVDMSLLAVTAAKEWSASKGKAAGPPPEDWKRTDNRFLVMWVIFWAIGIAMT